MPDRRGATLFEDLPEEIIDMILIRLPSKDVGRCRVVSTSLRSATSTTEFMLEHHRRQPSLPIIDGNWQPSGLVVFRGTGASQRLWPFIQDSESRLTGLLHSACDGFLIRTFGSRFYIYNPIIRKHALLPQPQLGQTFYNAIIGFYRYHPTGEYRILWVSRSHQSSKSRLYVLTVGSNKPRHIRVRMPTVSPPSVKHKLLKVLSRPSCCSPPVHHRGSLYWCPYGGSDILGAGGDIIVFDTEAESFRCMHSPTHLCRNRNLSLMEGTLALWGSLTYGIYILGFSSIGIWLMQDNEAEIWAFKYRIDVSTVEASRQLYFNSYKREKKTPHDSRVEEFNDMAVVNERELLIMFNEKHVLRCDIYGKFLGIVKIRKSQFCGLSQYCMELTQHRLQESIIPIPAHEMQGEDEEPPFSIGHV